jgi:hypothetical protein
MNRIYTEMEHAREKAFGSIWSSEIDAVFSDVAEYYDRANVYATLSLNHFDVVTLQWATRSPRWALPTWSAGRCWPGRSASTPRENRLKG